MIKLMAMVRALPICFVLWFCTGFLAKGQSTEEATQAFILKVMSDYKNPLAYYPFNRDIFLPSQQELDSLDRAFQRSPYVRGRSPFLFVYGDSLKRESFVDATGRPLFPQGLLNLKTTLPSGYDYALRRQRVLLKSNPNAGRFLLYNQEFRKLNKSQKH
ncbi:hypothetical protein [Roseivirga sp. UBA1976]|uniref:hypothetical protein n=1 Tax=Roseivirga sp. UBA1976 TaxID=1947386 RepID=UPI00257EA1CD|nr:hypothetical protein [Roseivirga sp. UBA1976]MEC7755316.1 hypothetical protein [Bacteroidota bacterium]|tara:strand:+ start:4374 stop:4850 length:477 start_codon:yes stop_codon:yes gene_type:complete